MKIRYFYLRYYHNIFSIWCVVVVVIAINIFLYRQVFILLLLLLLSLLLLLPLLLHYLLWPLLLFYIYISYRYRRRLYCWHQILLLFHRKSVNMPEESGTFTFTARRKVCADISLLVKLAWNLFFSHRSSFLFHSVSHHKCS